MRLLSKSRKDKAKISENPFDKFQNSRSKHEVVNRRVKGEDRDVGRAREKATEQRKKRITTQLKASKSSNIFTDKRFGENDPALSLEEKMFMRFQKERSSRLRSSKLFNLDDDDTPGELLTHKGQILGAGNSLNDDLSDDDNNDDDGALDKEVVNTLHFGGGLVPVKDQSRNNQGIYGPASAPKTRQEMLQEIVMKSKLAKLERKEAKEAQENGTAKIDDDFDALLASADLEFRPMGRDRGRFEREQEKVEQEICIAAGLSAEKPKEDDVFSNYDKELRAMAFEAKVRATDRTKTPEELALEARERLQKAEEARLTRMHGPTDAEMEQEAEEQRRDAEQHGKIDSFGNDVIVRGPNGIVSMGSRSNGTQTRRVTDDDIEGVDRVKKKGASWALSNMGKHIVDTVQDRGEGDREDYREDEDEDWDWQEVDDEEGEEEEEEKEWALEGVERAGSDEEEGNGDDSGYDNEGAPLDADNIAMLRKLVANADGNKTDEDSDSKDDNGNVVRQDEINGDDNAPTIVNPHMPMIIEAPTNMDLWDELIDRHVRNSIDITTMIDRIVAWNSVHLPAPDGVKNRERMHNFLAVLIKHFVSVGDALVNAAAAAADVNLQQVAITADENGYDDIEDPEIADMEGQLHHLTGVIYQLCTDLPEASVPLFGRTLKTMRTFLENRLRDHSVGTREASCWPSLGKILLMAMIGRVFSVTDYRHSVVTSASMFLCQCLTQCPVSSLQDLCSGLLCCSVLLDYTYDSGRFVPEVQSFITSVLSLFVIQKAEVNEIDKTKVHDDYNKINFLQASIDKNHFGWLRYTWSKVGDEVQIGKYEHEYENNELDNTLNDSDNNRNNLDSRSRSDKSGNSISRFRVPWSCFDKAFSTALAHPSTRSQRQVSRQVSTAILCCCHSLAAHIIERFDPIDNRDNDMMMAVPQEARSAFPELMQSLVGVLRLVKPHTTPTMSTEIQKAHMELLQRLTTRSVWYRAHRAPLRWRTKGLNILQVKNPRFEIDYKLRKDKESDRNKAALKQLTRQKKREHKAALREIRRDSDFLDQHDFANQQAAASRRQEERFRNYNDLQSQVGMSNELVKKGGAIAKGGGSSQFKPKKRLKRGI